MQKRIHLRAKKLKKDMDLFHKKENYPIKLYLMRGQTKVFKLSLNKIIIPGKRLFLQMDMEKSAKQILK